LLPAEEQAAPQKFWELDARLHPYLSPFLTDAELLEYRGDLAGSIAHKGGRCAFYLPGITQVTFLDAGGQTFSPKLSDKKEDVLVYDLPAGSYQIQVDTDSKAGVFASHLELVSADVSANVAKALDNAEPGQEVLLPPGIYSDVKWILKKSGTERAPIVIRPQIPGSVVLRGASAIAITGSWMVFQGACFDQSGPGSCISISGGAHNRITQCQFFFCGSPESTYGRIVDFSMGAAENRLDHAYFIGSKSQSCGQLVIEPAQTGQHNRFDHNIYRNIIRFWSNGQECVQIGQKSEYIHTEPRDRVDSNLFENAGADVEIVSNKCSFNKYEHNLFAYCPESALSLRAGTNAEVVGNIFVKTGNGVSVRGSNHVIRDNLIWEPEQSGIRLGAGGEAGATTEVATHVVIEKNLIVFPRNRGIYVEPKGPKGPLSAHDCTIKENLLFVGTPDDALYGFKPDDGNQLVSNKVVAGKDYIAPAANDKASRLVAALLQNSQNPEVKKVSPSFPSGSGDALYSACPPLPPYRAWSTDDLKGEKLELKPVPSGPDPSEAGFKLENGRLELPVPLPEEFVLEWNYRPNNWAAIASLSLSAGSDEVILRWGGVDKKGDKPRGLVELFGKDQQTANLKCPDLVNHRQDFKSPNPPRPDQMRDYRFRLVKTKTLLRLEMLRWNSDKGQFDSNEFAPVLLWENEALGRNAAWTVRLAQTGSGIWSQVNGWKLKLP